MLTCAPALPHTLIHFCTSYRASPFVISASNQVTLPTGRPTRARCPSRSLFRPRVRQQCSRRRATFTLTMSTQCFSPPTLSRSVRLGRMASNYHRITPLNLMIIFRMFSRLQSMRLRRIFTRICSSMQRSTLLRCVFRSDERISVIHVVLCQTRKS